jgi:hypothetical protein
MYDSHGSAELASAALVGWVWDVTTAFYGTVNSLQVLYFQQLAVGFLAYLLTIVLHRTMGSHSDGCATHVSISADYVGARTDLPFRR